MTEIAYRQQLAQTQKFLNVQTLAIVIGSMIIAFFAGYVYHDQLKGENE